MRCMFGYAIYVEREGERKRRDLEIAIDMGEADFGLVFEGTVGFAPSL